MRRTCVLMSLLGFGLTLMGFDEKMPNPIMNAKVGDWLLYEVTGDMHQKQTVVAVTDEVVEVKIDSMVGGIVIHSMSMICPKTGTKLRQPKISFTSIVLHGKKTACTLAQTEDRRRIIETWISKDIPITGIVKTEVDGTTTMKLVDWGRDADVKSELEFSRLHKAQDSGITKEDGYEKR